MKEKASFFICCFLLFLSCIDDKTVSTDYTAEEIEVSFSPELITKHGNGFIETENRLEEMDIFVCKNGIFKYHRSAWKAEDVYKSILMIDQDLTLHFIANSRPLIQKLKDTDKLVSDTPWENIRLLLTDNEPNRFAGGTTLLPMWGMKKNVIVKDADLNSLGTISLLRSVAGVDVEIALGPDIFDLQEAYLYYIPSAGLIAPSESNYNPDNSFTKRPEMPSGSTCYGVIRTEKNTWENEIKNALYLFENEATGITGGRRTTRLVIGGYYNNDYSVPTYYPLDFVHENKFMEIMRNYKFTFTITSVSGKGHPDPDTAAGAAAVNMSYEVIDWKHALDEEIVVDGPYYLSIRRKKVEPGPSREAEVILPFSTNVKADDLTISLKDPSSEEIQLIGGETAIRKVRSDLFEVELSHTQGEEYSLRFTALQDWAPAHQDKLILTAGPRIRTEITIIQSDEEGSEWVGGDEINIGE